MDTMKYAFPDLRLSESQAEKLKHHFLLVNNFGEGCDLVEWKIIKER